MMPKEFKTKILEKKEIAKDTYEIIFKRPDELDYLSGQYMIVRVQSRMQDGKAPVRALSFSSSPINKETISTCFRYEEEPSDFKKFLIEDATEVTIRAPLGKFIIQEAEEITMIAGGVGIVPFVSMLRYLGETKSKQKIKLIYTDKFKEKMAYLGQLKKIEKENKNFKLITRLKRVDKKFLKEKSNLNSLFYICGVPEMVENVASMLKELEVKEENLILEKY